MMFFTIHRSWASSLAYPSRTCSHWIRVRYCHDDFVNILALLSFISLCVYGASDIVNGSVKYSSVLDTLLLTGGFKNLVVLST